MGHVSKSTQVVDKKAVVTCPECKQCHTLKSLLEIELQCGETCTAPHVDFARLVSLIIPDVYIETTVSPKLEETLENPEYRVVVSVCGSESTLTRILRPQIPNLSALIAGICEFGSGTKYQQDRALAYIPQQTSDQPTDKVSVDSCKISTYIDSRVVVNRASVWHQDLAVLSDTIDYTTTGPATIPTLQRECMLETRQHCPTARKASGLWSRTHPKVPTFPKSFGQT
ncbi:hypothetical protein BDR26DRAFT_942302 [Obelidium mucronatum]|nr:hypothetical protein BDR26DRAFT_942302 [Obelidium mucronatum]